MPDLETKMKMILLPLATLICAAAFAQAPAGTTPRPAQEADANKSGGMPAAKADMKTDAKKGAMPMASGGSVPATNAMGMRAMDTNGDGMVSRKEWNAYHGGMWGKMKLKNGMASMADVEAMMKGGPN